MIQLVAGFGTKKKPADIAVAGVLSFDGAACLQANRITESISGGAILPDYLISVNNYFTGSLNDQNRPRLRRLGTGCV